MTRCVIRSPCRFCWKICISPRSRTKKCFCLAGTDISLRQRRSFIRLTILLRGVAVLKRQDVEWRIVLWDQSLPVWGNNGSDLWISFLEKHVLALKSVLSDISKKPQNVELTLLENWVCSLLHNHKDSNRKSRERWLDWMQGGSHTHS